MDCTIDLYTHDCTTGWQEGRMTAGHNNYEQNMKENMGDHTRDTLQDWDKD